MSDERLCESCHQTFPISSGRCPHCALPGLFPNVAMAELDDERRALSGRYEAAVEDAARRGCEDNVRAFESAAARSQAVVARSHAETSRLAHADHNLYATYHQLIESELRIPEGSKWDRLRTVADEMLFGTYKREVRFGALAVDGVGLTHYGDCSWVLQEDMIAHRASVFEENSAMFVERRWSELGKSRELPPGYRATWPDRSKLSVAKLAGKIDRTTSPRDFQELLLRQGSTPEEDAFVEVHVGGPMTVRTLERVIIERSVRRNAIGRALRVKLEKMGVPVEGRTWTH